MIGSGTELPSRRWTGTRLPRALRATSACPKAVGGGAGGEAAAAAALNAVHGYNAYGRAIPVRADFHLVRE